MATFTCQTARWVSTSPYVKLTITTTEGATTVTVAYKLQYISDYGTASATAAKGYSVTIGGTVVASGTCSINGKSSFTVCEGSKTYAKTKATQTLACSCSFNFNLTWSGNYCTGKSASVNATISPKTSYTITYNANGGTGAPGAQTKWYGESLTLSSTKPTRTGYTFQGWGTSSTDTSVDYQPGAGYTANAALNLYAIWKANTYKVTYNANGGSGAPAAQTKTHGQSLTLTTSKPTRANYTFKGWATTATGAVSYQPGGSYTANAAITLYAVWELSYVLPKIYNVFVDWSSSFEPETGSDGIAKQRPDVGFDWETTNPNPSFTFDFYSADGVKVYSQTIRISSGATYNDYGPEVMNNNEALLDFDKSYTVKITGTDGGGSTTVTATLTGNIYPIDILAEGKGVSFGGPASLKDTAHFQWDARFDKSVCGNVPGMYRLPEIPANADFNNYMTTGCWAVYKNANAETIANIPVARAGRLEVWSATGEGIRAAEWSYLRQRFIPYNAENATWERDIARGEDNVWRYYDWHRTTLTPEASNKIYSIKSYLTATILANVAMSTVNTYTIIPLKSYKLYAGGKLTLQSDGSVKIGAGISMVKVSGQVLVKCGSTAGNRHVKIQRLTASGTVTDVAWCCITGTDGDNLVFPFTPIILTVSEGETLRFAYYTTDSSDAAQKGGNGYQTYIMVEEF